MIRRLLIGTSLLLSLLTMQPAIASAHILEQDNGVTAVLHIPPFDAPEANTNTPLEFEFGSNKGSFHINDYKLALTIAVDGKTIAQQAVEPSYFGSTVDGNTSFTFPKIAIYSIKLRGQGIADAAPNFAVEYNVRVASSHGAPASKQSGNASEVVLIGVTIFVLFAMVAARQIAVGGRYASKPKSKDK